MQKEIIRTRKSCEKDKTRLELSRGSGDKTPSLSITSMDSVLLKENSVLAGAKQKEMPISVKHFGEKEEALRFYTDC